MQSSMIGEAYNIIETLFQKNQVFYQPQVIDNSIKMADYETEFHFFWNYMNHRILSINQWLEKRMPLLTPLGVILGFLFPFLFLPLRPAIPLLFGFITLSGAMDLQSRELISVFARPKVFILFFIVSHLFMPVIGYVFSTICNPDNPVYTAGFVLLFSIPTAVSGFIWNTIFKGDGALSLSLIFLDTICSPFVVPLTVFILIGQGISLSFTDLSTSLFLMVVFPTILGVFLNESSKGSIPAQMGPISKPVAKLFLILVVAANSSALAPQIDWRNGSVYWIAFQAIILGMAGFLLGHLLGKAGGFSPPQSRTLVFSVGLRNISAAATIAIAYFPAQAALPAILGMIFQQSLAAFAGKIFIGKPDSNRV